MKNCELINILLVEDDAIEVRLFKRCWQRAQTNMALHFASDGEQALQKLQQGDIPLPRIIILDLNMPRMNGIEFLKALRCDPKLHNSVVFVMTTSSSRSDIQQAYQYNVAGFMVKSQLGDNFSAAIDLIDAYSKAVQLPS